MNADLNNLTFQVYEMITVTVVTVAELALLNNCPFAIHS